MKRFLNCLLAGVVLLCAVSCATSKKISYLTDMEYGIDYPAQPAPELVIQPDDCLSIQVSCETPELAAPFNLFRGESVAINYLVDKDGNISFPILGTVNVGGQTIPQVRETISAKIRDGGYMKEPIVLVSLENFTITVLGKTKNAVIPVEGNSINILQLIASTGDITGQSKIRDVMVIRTENGVRRAYSVNLQSKDLFDSPVFYLRQQDIVYVKPQGTSLSTSGQTVMSFVGSALSLVTIITNYILWSSTR